MILRTLGQGVVFGLVAIGAGCGGNGTHPTVVTGQIITFSDTLTYPTDADTVRFGRLRSGETVVKQLQLHNAGTMPVVITSHTRTCGCSTLELDLQPIMPGEKRPATLIFDSQGLSGWQFKMIELELAGGVARRRIYIDAEVE